MARRRRPARMGHQRFRRGRPTVVCQRSRPPRRIHQDRVAEGAVRHGVRPNYEGYRETINAAVDGDRADVKPIVLAQGDEWLQKIAVKQIKSPPAFWHSLEPHSDGATTKSVARKNIPGVASR